MFIFLLQKVSFKISILLSVYDIYSKSIFYFFLKFISFHFDTTLFIRKKKLYKKIFQAKT